MIHFACPNCQKALKAPDHGAGSKVKCPKCGQKLLVPPPTRAQNKTVLGQSIPGPSDFPPSPQTPASQQSSVQASFECPTCQTTFFVPERMIGRMVGCPKCQTTFAALSDDNAQTTMFTEPLLYDDNVQDEVQFDNPKNNQWAMFLHFSLLSGYVVPIAGWVLPIILWQMKKESPEIDAHRKNVCNWLLTNVLSSVILIILMLFGVVVSIIPIIGCFVLVLFILCIPLLIVTHTLGIVYPIIGGIKANDGKLWVYPGTIAFLK